MDGEAASALVYPIGICASLLGIIQGVTWAVLGLFSVLCYYHIYKYEISTTSHYETLSSFIYYLYFKDDPDNNIVRAETANVQPKVLETFSWIYVFLSSVWCYWSYRQLKAVLKQKLDSLKRSFIVWNVLTVSVALVDLVLLSLLADDYDLYNKMDFTIEAGAVGLSYTLIANGVMMSLAARGYVLWFVNVIFVWAVYKITPKDVRIETVRSDDALEAGRQPEQRWKGPYYFSMDAERQKQSNSNNNNEVPTASSSVESEEREMASFPAQSYYQFSIDRPSDDLLRMAQTTIEHQKWLDNLRR